jgi:hypothetical protein
MPTDRGHNGIAVGLLIAIGLEQTVEAIHHHHERIQLEEDLRNEAELNVRSSTKNCSGTSPNRPGLQASLVAMWMKKSFQVWVGWGTWTSSMRDRGLLG